MNPVSNKYLLRVGATQAVLGAFSIGFVVGGSQHVQVYYYSTPWLFSLTAMSGVGAYLLTEAAHKFWMIWKSHKRTTYCYYCAELTPTRGGDCAACCLSKTTDNM